MSATRYEWTLVPATCSPRTAAVQTAVDQANTLVSKAEAARSFTVLAAPLTEESGHLTPSLKLKRAAVVRGFEGEITRLYGS
ncbi:MULTISPECIES: hypothetical protein [unclassified Arthrobacter]|uniref:hypothetical protein n=1 Tax=unclassified Arthrobacter TaxID=235627 RepID=UPI0033965C81